MSLSDAAKVTAEALLRRGTAPATPPASRGDGHPPASSRKRWALLAGAVALHGLATGPFIGVAAAAPAAHAVQATRTADSTAGAFPALLPWVLTSRDNEGAPFIVIDKRRARLWLYDAQGRTLGQTPILLGKARGDVSVPGIGERPMALIQEHERTTPAGRFVAEPGHNAAGEDIFWIDYDAAISMHRVRATNPAERRLQRLASATPDDNRISYGCINVPADFYDGQIRPAFSRQRGVVYLMPETLPLQSLFTPVAGAAAAR